VAFCERIAHLLPDDRSRDWIVVARRYADRQVRRTEVAAAHEGASRAYDQGCFRWKNLRDRATTSAHRAVRWATHPTQRYYAQYAANDAAEAAAYFANADTPDPAGFLQREVLEHPAECAVQLALVRDVLGRPELQGPSAAWWGAWQGGQASKLARAIYEDRAFEGMPELGDALEEAGCTDASILGHLRGSGPHVRGCWVVDLILGKE
jgi:hypothetical protein